MATKWKALRDDVLSSPEAQAAYEEARRDYELGLQVRALREAAGMSQAELASRMGTSQPAVARLESGGGTPKLETLNKAAAALGVRLVVSFEEPRSVGTRPSKRRTAKAVPKAAAAKVPVKRPGKLVTMKSSGVKQTTIKTAKRAAN